MEILLKKDELTKKLEMASRFIGSGRKKLEVTKGLLLTADESGVLFIDASDFIHGCKIKIDNTKKIKVKTPGEIVVEGKKFIELINSLNGEEVKLKLTSNNRLKITEISNERVDEFQMAIYKDGPEKFATIPIPSNEADKVTIKKEEFLNVLRLIGFGAENAGSLFDDNLNQISKMIFFTNDLVYATNGQKFGAMKKPTIKISGLYLPKGAINYFRDLNEEFTLYIEGDIFYVQDEDLFFMVKVPVVSPPTESIKRIMHDDFDGVVEYKLNKKEKNEIINSLTQIKILNDYVTFYLTPEVMWMSGVDYENSASNSIHTSLKALKLPAQKCKTDILVSFNIKYVTQALRKTSAPKIIFEGDYKDKNAFLRIYENNFQAVIQRMVEKNEEKIYQKIQEFNS